jgi:hypothetical protein
MTTTEKVYSKITGKRRPPCIRTRTKEPNLDLMAKAIINMYYQTKENELESVNNS